VSAAARYPWWMGPAAVSGAAMIRALGATWTIDRHGLADYDRLLASGERCIFAFWHARMLPLVFTHRGRGVTVLVSRHRDGELITRIIEHLGFRTARGSSTRGGEEGVREMLQSAERGHLLAVTPDGPRGPAERVKPGLVWLAAHLGWPVVPVSSAARSARRLRSWDGFRVPRPFTRVVVAYGAPLHVGPGTSREHLERERLRIESALAALTRDTDARADARP
jgi:lysophospholipid acyltransferase (LPLAT)-like uncharacterized protein